MANDSSTGGFLLPDGAITAPLEDETLDDFLHDIVAGVTGLGGTLVRPRWQPEPAAIPSFGTDWLAFGIVSRRADSFAVEIHDGSGANGAGVDILIRHEELDLLCSFYGPNCQGYGSLLRDGICVAQNREALFLAGMGLISVGDLTRAPELIKNRWVPRCDLTMRLRREIRREYAVLNLRTAALSVAADTIAQVDVAILIDEGQTLDFSDPLNSGLNPAL
jgi:hypothetical protein